MKLEYTAEDIDRTVALYLTGLPTRKIASLVGLSPTQVAKIVSRADVARERMTAFNLSRKRAIPDNWSFAPLTPEKAWMLGLIYGDGSLSSQGYAITITSGDRDVIDNVNMILGGNVGIVDRKTYLDLNICSGRLWKEIRDLYGLHPNKSKTMQYPKLPMELQPHFVRGLIDNDGCWYTDRRSKSPRLMFTYEACQNTLSLTLEIFLSHL
jgi:hypothetical protein